MTQTTKTCMMRFVGLDIKLWLKNGKTVKLGDGLFISDGIKVHAWIGTSSDSGKNIMIATQAQEWEVKNIEQVTYRDINSGNFKELRL